MDIEQSKHFKMLIEWMQTHQDKLTPDFHKDMELLTKMLHGGVTNVWEIMQSLSPETRLKFIECMAYVTKGRKNA